MATTPKLKCNDLYAGNPAAFKVCALKNEIYERFTFHLNQSAILPLLKDTLDLAAGVSALGFEQAYGALASWFSDDEGAETPPDELATNLPKEVWLAAELSMYAAELIGTLVVPAVGATGQADTLIETLEGATFNSIHIPLASPNVAVYLGDTASFKENVTYQYKVEGEEKTHTYATLFGAWFWSSLLTEGKTDDDGYWTFPRPLTQPELQYLFSGDVSLQTGWELIAARTGMTEYSEFLNFLFYTSPGVFKALPFYDSYLQPGGEFSFDKFDSAILDKVAAEIQPASREDQPRPLGIQTQVKGLLTWEDPILALSLHEKGFLNRAGLRLRYAQIEKAEMVLPPMQEAETAYTDSRDDFVDKILGPLFGNIQGLSQLNFQTIEGAGGNQLSSPVPDYLNARTGLLRFILTSKTSDTKTIKHYVLEHYFKFINSIIEDDKDVFWKTNDSTIREKFDAVINDTNTTDGIWYPAVVMVYQNTENLARIAFWQLAREAVRSFEEGEKDWEAAPAYAAIIQKNLENKGVVPPPGGVPDKDKLTVENIAGRQRFFKQCALLLNAQILKKTYRTQLRMEHAADPTRKPFDGRLYMLEVGDGDEDKLINVLTTGGSVKGFFDLTPAEVSALAPKIQLFRVTNDESSGKLTQTEFVFPRTTSLDRGPAGGWKEKTTFLTEPFDKGDGMGLKEFSFNFNGTNPAEARKDIQATLVLYFQSFADLVRDRKTGAKGETYKYVDLIIHPRFTKSNSDKVPVHPNAYDPKFYRIRVDVGYHKGSAPEHLHEALEITNASYYLNMVDHDIKIAPDGSVTLTVNYQAYQETALKSNEFDALATPAMISRRKKNMQTFREMLLSGKCTEQEIQDFKLAISAQATAARRHSLSSIMRRLSHKKKIYMCKLSPQDATTFRTLGFFKDGAALVSFSDETKVLDDPKKVLTSANIVDESFFRNALTAETYNDASDSIIQYFYFGDLLEVICDSMYQEKHQNVPVEGMENLKFLLGSFDFDPYATKEGDAKILNIGEIPISTNYFSRWFIENIVTQGYTRDAFPILLFIRNLANNLLETSLLETCINRNVKKNLRFQTSIVVASNEAEHDPLLSLVGGEKGKDPAIVLNTMDLRARGVLPLSQQSDISIANYYNYLLLSTVGSTLTKAGRGNYEQDVSDGRFHIGIGSNRGIVKTISFSKTDMQYVREARFQSNGIDGLMQLSNVYVATIEMFGNTIFYPGMEVYINPYGIGGTVLGSPTDVDSIANKLGFGGYHTITNVKTSLSPGSFKTTIQAQWYFSGNPQAAQADKDGVIPESRFLEVQSISASVSPPNRDQDYCVGILRGAESDVSRLMADPTYDGIASAEAPATAATEDGAPPVNTETPTDTTLQTLAFDDINTGKSKVITYNPAEIQTTTVGSVTTTTYFNASSVVATMEDVGWQTVVSFPDGQTFVAFEDETIKAGTPASQMTSEPTPEPPEEPPVSEPLETEPLESEPLESERPESSPPPIPEEIVEEESLGPVILLEKPGDNYEVTLIPDIGEAVLLGTFSDLDEAYEYINNKYPNAQLEEDLPQSLFASWF